MASYFHLIFEFIRISILASVYGYVIWILFAKVFKIKALKIGYIAIVLFLSLFIWRFSYWRDNGIGESARIPLNSKYQVNMIDFYYAGILDNNHRNLTFGIKKLYLENELLYGQTDRGYIVFNTNSGLIKKGLSEQQFLANNGKLNKLLSLDTFHNNYWSIKLLLLF